MSSSEEKGLLQVYTGKGRGKTTSAAGQAIRAFAHDIQVVFVTFFKGGDRFSLGITCALEDLGIEVKNFCREHPFFGNVGREEAREDCLAGLHYMSSFFKEEGVGLLVGDEAILPLRDGLVSREEFESMLDDRPDGVELVLTGRGAPSFLVERADLVSRIECVKHPIQKGILARPGFDY